MNVIFSKKEEKEEKEKEEELKKEEKKRKAFTIIHDPHPTLTPHASLFPYSSFRKNTFTDETHVVE